LNYGQWTSDASILSAMRATRPRPKKTAKVHRPSKGGPSSRLRLDVDERRAQLVKLGLAEFGTRTYDEVSIDQIAQVAGISKGLLYHYFPTKRAFYVACVREACRELIDQVSRAPTESYDTPLDLVRLGLERYLDHVRAHGRAFATLMRSGVGADSEIAAVVNETRQWLLAQLTSGMTEIFPGLGRSATTSPLLDIALHGWIGLVEAASIAWVERDGSGPPKASASDVRDLLVSMLVTMVQALVRS
jgi:AcrR family transcriptional regulator